MDLPTGQSAFLWGARKTGKSTYLHEKYPDAIYYDLLKSDTYLKLSKAPYLLREEILSLDDDFIQRHPIIVDEIQKIPALLDEIHWLIENKKAYFILCGSSARKLKQVGVNMLGGRAWRFHFFPLTWPEITDFNLLKALNFGTIPSHYTMQNPKKSLKAYIADYLILEIQAQGIVRHLPAFSRFLDSLAFSHGEMINFSNIAGDCGISSPTVKEYFQILVDTLFGYYVLPFRKHVKRDIITETPKFYLFDVGVANTMCKRSLESLSGPEAGRTLEHFIFLELYAYISLNDLDFDIKYWRTKTGLEVDFVVNEIPIEVKISSQVRTKDIKGIVAFCQEHGTKNAYVVSLDERSRQISDQITVLPCQEFLSRLWNGQII